ncbi:hypothetical protein NB709_003344 [Xanthomonas sacchari]|nr:hypothetical protein [Xanthomonas sacchari]
MMTMTRGLRLLLLAVILSLAACASSGQAVKPIACPTVPPLPQKLLNKTDYAGQVRRELYEPANSPSPSETKSSTDTKP